MNSDPNEERSRRPSFTAFLALLVIGLALLFILNLLFDWAERNWGISVLGIGRRMDVGAVLSMCLAYALTCGIARAFGFRSQRKQRL